MELLRVRRFSVYVSKIARGHNGETPPWRGYCWGSDFPRINLQKSPGCYCLDLSWLCYFMSIYWNRRSSSTATEGR